MKSVLLEVDKLFMRFKTEKGLLPAVNNVSFHVNQGETVALVGESGCGKSVTSLSIMRLIARQAGQVEGSIRFKGRELNHLSEKEMRALRGNEISMIFQEPMTSLNPVHTVGKQVGEVFKVHTNFSKAEKEQKTVEMLKKVGIPRAEKIVREFPHQLSGGMKQRVMIAMAMACQPDLLIADEPTTALDVTIQAQILDLMNELKQNSNTAILLITHDLGVVAEMADRIMVMYYGEIVEEADVTSIFSNPRHPYTVGLLRSVPDIDEEQDRLASIKGNVPLLGEVMSGCPFFSRCEHAHEKCRQEKPPLMTIAQQRVRCWLYAREEITI
ncbi:ABC transporter ATP-binding protein [Brevibacillus reuszeri]|uniref:ABC transporter ATP-binding protein n=1 Tax=Brevibacillus reuszeri TaxID=54915 RepID=UPI0028A0BB7D|nr:ABC transporter ATP-binding protein [Brevibacillus reuszeri]